MIRRILIPALMALTACSGAAPTVDSPAIPSTILLPADPAPGPATMFIGELGAAAIRQGNTWVAVAEVTVLDGDDQPVAGALVSGVWDEGDTDTTACTTDQSGRCELESGSIRRRVSQTTVAITDVEHDELSYQPELDAVDNPEDQPRELAIRKP